jgi:zinc-ribbon domain
MVLFVAILGVTLLSPYAYAAPVTVSISPTNQAVPQGTSASYTVSLSGGAATSFYLTVTGLSGSGSFSPNPVSTPPGGGTGAGSTTLSVTTGAPGLYCPGNYAFTVTATNATDGPLPSPPGAQNPETGSATATLNVVQVGPALSVSVATDKSTYTTGDTVTILVSANRPATGRLTVSPPTGAPSVFDYQLLTGSYSITKTLTASSVGHWTVSFQANDFCSGVSSAQASFDVSPNTYDVSLSLNGVPSQYTAQLQVDGQPQGGIGGGQIEELTFKLNTTHMLSVDQYVAGDTGVRYYCAQNTLSVSSSGSFTFSYQTQYQFTVQTDPSGITQVTGSGWFPAGTGVQTNQVPAVVSGGTGTQYAFKGWDVNGTPQTGNPISITMDKPYTATAKYTTQYQLVVDSAYGSPKGAGYYDAGTAAQFSVTTPSGFPIQRVFVQWQGDYTGTSPQGSIAMDKPHTVHAVWTTSYIPLIAIIVVAAAVIAGLLLRRSRRRPPPETKPTPTPATEDPGTPAGAIKCKNCGAENSPGQKYCMSCGEKLT